MSVRARTALLRIAAGPIRTAAGLHERLIALDLRALDRELVSVTLRWRWRRLRRRLSWWWRR